MDKLCRAILRLLIAMAGVVFSINNKLVASFKGEASFLKGNRLFFLIPILIHGSYNTTVYFLETRWDWW